MDLTKKQSGFTLLELVIVIIVLSIISTVVLFNWPGMTVNVGGQAQQLANDIRYTQALAMSKGQRYYLIKQSSTTYQIKSTSGSTVLLALGNTTMTLNSGITFGSFTNLPNNLIAFDGKGAPYTDTGSPGTALSSTATMALVSGSNTKTISISPETGRVTVS